MAKKAKSQHPIFKWFKDMIIGIILVIIIFWLCGITFTDVWNHTPSHPKHMEEQIKTSAIQTYQRNDKPLQAYVRQRSNGDLKKMSPRVKLTNQLPKWAFGKNGQATVKYISMDDTGNGTFILHGHKYLFQLANLQFAPHNSQFYKKNKSAIQSDIQTEISSGNFHITRGANHQIYLYKGNDLVANDFLRKGIAYVSNLKTNQSMTKTEKHAKSEKMGFWSIPHIVGGNPETQIYSIASENGHHIPVAGVKSHEHGGKSFSQSIGSWFDRH